MLSIRDISKVAKRALPGPWVAEGGFVDDRDGNSVWTALGMYSVPEGSTESRSLSDVQIMANADLTAAAPEMAEALRRADYVVRIAERLRSGKRVDTADLDAAIIAYREHVSDA